MDLITLAIDWVLHLDHHLNQLAGDFGPWTYAILFMVVFCETGLVVTPFLPGDSLLFACGALAASENAVLEVQWLIPVFILACFVGDNTNYFIGKAIGPRVFSFESSRFFNKQHLERTHKFYEKHGGKTIIIARFIPIIRTFAPFVAGVGAMSYRRFISFSVFGCLLWVGGILMAGYWFGNVPIVKHNFTFVILAIIVISMIPPVIEWWRMHRATRREQPAK